MAGTNERHPAVDVFSFLGQMAVLQLHEAGIPVRGSRILVLCDNDFAPFIVRRPGHGGATIVTAVPRRPERDPAGCDAVLLALQPRATAGVRRGRRPSCWRARRRARSSCSTGATPTGRRWRPPASPVWPPRAPAAGHMGVLPSAVGPEPIVRLQSGGLKVGAGAGPRAGRGVAGRPRLRPDAVTRVTSAGAA